MSNLKTLLTTHTEHGWKLDTTDHIHRATLKDTHDLLTCEPCGWHGWVNKTAWDTQGIEKPIPEC